MLHFRQQRLERAPTDLAQIAIDIRHELLAIAGAVYGDMRPTQIAIRFPEAAIAYKGRFGSHGEIKAAVGATGKVDRCWIMISDPGMSENATTGLKYDALRRECLNAVRQWPGCESIGGIQIIRTTKPGGFSVRVTLYGKAKIRLADRAMAAVQREVRRHFHLVE